jgi:predicted transcriptional regulator
MKSAYLYIIILLVLTNIFTFSYYSKKNDFESTRYEKLKEKTTDSITVLGGMLIEANRFTIDRNQQAQDYFEDKNTGRFVHHEKIIQLISGQLMKQNQNEAGNPLTNFAPIDGKGFEISNFQVINHRWLVADFSNSIYNGQVLLQYSVGEDLSITFDVLQSVIFTN